MSGVRMPLTRRPRRPPPRDPRPGIVRSSRAPAGCCAVERVLERLRFLRRNTRIGTVAKVAQMIRVRLTLVARLLPELEPGTGVSTERRRHGKRPRVHQRIVDGDFP